MCLPARLAAGPQSNELLPLSQVHPGMPGYAYTIFEGDQIEKFDLEVIGVLENFLGPKQAIILVQLKGPKVEHTGVVAGDRKSTRLNSSHRCISYAVFCLKKKIKKINKKHN